MELLAAVAQELAVPLFVWSVTEGLGKAGGSALYNSDQPEQSLANIATIQGDAIFLLKDFARYCDDESHQPPAARFGGWISHGA